MIFENKFMNDFLKANRHLIELIMLLENNSNSYNKLLDSNIILLIMI